MKTHEIVVIGLGRFGSAVASELMAQGICVLGIDRDPALVQHYAHALTQTVALDSTDEAALQEIGISHFETVVVAIGTDFESSLITAVTCKQLGVRKVIAKAMTRRQQEILLKVGVDRVVLPEREAGERVAQEIAGVDVINRLLLDTNHSIVEIKTPPKLEGVSLLKSGLRERYGVNVLAVERNGDLMVSPPADYQLCADDKLVVMGTNEDLDRLSGLR